MLALTHPGEREPSTEPAYLFSGNQSSDWWEPDPEPWSGSWQRHSAVWVAPGRLLQYKLELGVMDSLGVTAQGSNSCLWHECFLTHEAKYILVEDTYVQPQILD